MSLGDLISGNNGTLNQIAAMGQGGTAGGPGGPGGSAVAFNQTGTPSQAQQSPPDLAQLYMKLYQQDRQADSIDRGLAGVASAFAAPGTQGSVYNSLAPASQRDPAAMLGNIVGLEQMQQQMRNRPSMIQAATGGGGAPGAGGGGLDPSVANSMSNEELIKWNQSQAQARAQSGIAIAQKGTEAKAADLLEAQQKAPGQMTQIQQMTDMAGQIKGATEQDGTTPVMQSILGSATKKAAAMELMEAKEDASPIMSQIWASALTPEEQGALMKMKQLNNQVYGQAFESTGSRRTGQEVANLRSGLSPLLNFNQPYKNYMDQFGNFQDQLNKSYVNNLGAAGRTDEIPDNLKFGADKKPMVNSAFLPGGDLYAGKGGQWAASPPPQNNATANAPSFDYGKIPSGTVYTAPDGTQRRKP